MNSIVTEATIKVKDQYNLVYNVCELLKEALGVEIDDNNRKDIYTVLINIYKNSYFLIKNQKTV